jgi:hypothetical protein
MKVTKSKLTQLVQEELSNTMTEYFTTVDALSPLKDAENKGIVDAQDDFARIQAGGKVLQTDETEETQEEEIAYAKAYHKTMDRLKQNVADRKLYRPPEPEGEDHDVQHYDGEFFQEGKAKITKSKLAQIVKEELTAMKAEGYDAGKAVWMEKFKLHARVPQNQELSDEMKNNAQDAFRQGMNPAQAAKELSAVKAEGYGAYKRDDKNKKGLSPQYRDTDAASTDDTEDRFHKSEHSPYSDKKPKRGKKGLEEDLAPYSGLEDYVLQTLSTLGGEQPLIDIAAVAGEAWAADNWSDDDLIDEEDMFYSVQEALENLQADGRVRLTREDWLPDQDFYALAQ